MTHLHAKALVASLALGFVSCLLSLPVAADEKEGREIRGWGKVTDPDGDCEIKATDGGVSLKLPGSPHDFAAELQLQNSPRVLASMEGDFIAEVKVSGEFKPGETSKIEGRRAYQGAGLLLVKDKSNYISLHRGSVYLDDHVRHYANFELRQNGEMAVSLFEIEIPDGDTYLRLERRGDRVFGSASSDGVQWKTYDPITLKLPKVVEFGVLGVNSSDVPMKVAFQDLEIFRKAKAD